jgi:hypoxanthine phosphoribosyltransferase
MSLSAEDARRALAESDCLHDEAAVSAAYDRLAAAITAEYAQLNPLILCVMIGGLQPTAEILRRLRFPFQLDYLHATRYRGATTGGGLIWKRQPPAILDGRHVLVIDDILDEGHTLVAIRKALAEFAPLSLKVAVLAEKLHDRRAADAHAEFIGLSVVDRYVFGCGMDYQEYWRQLPTIQALKSA